ncbi:FkbM family methyltransferase [Actinomadura rugatobispora]|uniref:FkbM family methyltransferase n=1 Tax=Actinomadura rugatobispora TaxID=1994 RepID=A0ABW1AAT5_9ACTN|nr:hypothetical protein GCM10010200_010170 [Actinomadura rugatobispora]
MVLPEGAPTAGAEDEAARSGRFARAVARRVPPRLTAAVIWTIYPRVEPELARVRDFVPAGGTAVDVGGWFGPWTRRLSGLADRVVTLEAAPALAALLKRAFPRCEIVHAAASDECGHIDLSIPPAGEFAGVASVGRRGGDTVQVPKVTIDSLGLEDVRFIKLDIEGHELHALHGAAGTIRRDRPVLLIELEERHAPVRPVVDLLEGWGYTGHVLLDGRWASLVLRDLVAAQEATAHQLDRGLLAKALKPGRRYVNLVLFTPATERA